MAGSRKKPRTSKGKSAPGGTGKKKKSPADTPVNQSDATGTESPAAPWGEGVADRRILPDRRRMLEGNSESGLERRRGPGRRLSDALRSAEEGEMTQEQFLFLMAIDAFRRANNTTFPTWSDVLEVFRRLGYRKVQASTLNIPAAEDWTERPDAPLGACTKASERDAAAEFEDVDEDDDENDDDLIADDAIDELDSAA